MRKSVSSTYNVFARAAGKTIHWKVSIKKTASLSEDQSTGTWTDVTDHISKESLKKMKDSAELAYGQFSSQSITLIGLDIAYWQGNFFNYANYLEVKIEFWLNDLTSDTLVMFGGWVDKMKGEFRVKFEERKNSATFSVYSYQELANRTSAADLLFQPINSSVDGAGKAGLCLQNIPGMFVTNANIPNYVLKKGFHRVAYDYNGGTKQATLDGGTAITITGTGTFTLANDDGTQKLEIYAVNATLTQTNASQGIVVNTEGDTIPKTWYQRAFISLLLKKLYNRIGISDYSFDNFEITTYDGRYETSFFDIPPGDTFYKKPGPVMFDATNNRLWIGIYDKVFYRNLATNTYTEIGLVAAGYQVERFFTEQVTSDKLWGVACGRTLQTAGTWKIFRVTISTGALSSWTLTNRGTNGTWAQNFAFATNFETAGVIYYLATASPYHIWYFDLNTLAEIDTGITLASQPKYNLVGWSDGTSYWCQRAHTDPNYSYICKVYKDQGMWYANDSNAGNLVRDIEDGAYNTEENVFICGDTLDYVLSYSHLTGILTSLTISDAVKNFFYISGKVWCVREAVGSPNTLWIDYVDAGNITTLGGNVISPEICDRVSKPNRVVYDTIAGRILGIFDRTYLLFQYHTKSSMYTEIEANFEGTTVFDATKKLCIGFNLRTRVSATKKVYVLRRGDDTGTIVTTGNSVTLNADNAQDLTEETGSDDAFDIVTVSNRVKKESRDANGFGAVVFAGEREQTIDNEYLQTNLLKDAAYRFYQYWKNSHKRYAVPTPLVPFFQYEPFDGANLSFTGKIGATLAGIILGQQIDRNGKTRFEVEAS